MVGSIQIKALASIQINYLTSDIHPNQEKTSGIYPNQGHDRGYPQVCMPQTPPSCTACNYSISWVSALVYFCSAKHACNNCRYKTLRSGIQIPLLETGMPTSQETCSEWKDIQPSPVRQIQRYNSKTNAEQIGEKKGWSVRLRDFYMTYCQIYNLIKYV